MINIYNTIQRLCVIDLKHNVPQVGTKVIQYNSLKDLDSNKIYDFVVDIDGNLKIGTGHYKLNNKQKFLCFAGRLKLNDDHLIDYIDNDSGHYIPTFDETKKFVECIKPLDFVSDDVEIRHIKVEVYSLE